MTENFEATLQAMRERFIGNYPLANNGENDQFADFSALSADEKYEKISSSLELLDQEISSLTEKKASFQANPDTDSDEEITEINTRLKAINFKHEVLEHKLELLNNSKLEPAKREKMKRQLTQLEIKRCKNLLDKKNCHKIEAKIAHKKEVFKRVFG